MKNITLSADENLIEAARARAREERTTLNDLFRRWLTDYTQRRQQADRAMEVIKDLQKYVRTGKLRIKVEPWSILDRPGTGVTDSDRGQKATIAAAAQNKAFQFAEVLYFNSFQITCAFDRSASGVGWL